MLASEEAEVSSEGEISSELTSSVISYGISSPDLASMEAPANVSGME